VIGPRPPRCGLPFAVLVALAMGSIGCSKRELPPGERVLATVDGKPITEADLALALDETVGRDRSQVSEAARRKVLESLVATRAIAIRAEKELAGSDLAEIEKQVEAYRDDQLARLYISQNAPPEPVTDAMIEAYYREHLEQFGAHPVRSYELIASERVLTGQSRAEVIAAFGRADGNADWRALAGEMRKAGHAIRHDSGQLPNSALEQPISAVIDGLQPGQTSKPFFVGGKIVLARLLQLHEATARPLAEVTPDIRRTLEKRQLEAAVQRAGARATQSVEIVHRSK
jgi:PPIC-type PPIASE domain